MKASRKGYWKLASSGRPVPRDKTGGARSNNQNTEADYLDGQMLIAMPVMDDERFQRSVIYVCAHSSEGAMGIIVNRPAGSIDFPGLLMQLDIIKKGERITLPEDAEAMKVLNGGPVETGRGFVLHSSDFFIKDSTLPIDDDISLTATLDILKAIATGAGPKPRAFWRSAMPAGRRASWRTRSSTMAGCTVRPTPISCSAGTSTASTSAR